MKYIWAPEDISSGAIVCRQETSRALPKRDADGWDAKWTYQIGWIASGASRLNEDTTKPTQIVTRHGLSTRDLFVLISAADGMVSNPQTREELVKFLNENAMIPASGIVIERVYAFAAQCHNP